MTAPTGLVVYGWSRGPSPAVGFADVASLRAIWQRIAPELVPVELS